MLESGSLKEPMISLAGCDYSWFDRKFDMTMPEPPDHLKPAIRDDVPVEPFHCSDVKKIMSEHLAFESSANNLGLQLVDIVVNAIRRALHGNLQPDGWGNLGKLMVETKKDETLCECSFCITILFLKECHMGVSSSILTSFPSRCLMPSTCASTIKLNPDFCSSRLRCPIRFGQPSIL